MSAEKRRDPVATVEALVGRDDAETVDRLVQIYSKWAAYPETLEARKLALAALLRHPDARIGLEAVLTAVEGDQTRRAQDPMWPALVGGVAKLWNATTFPMGRDRYYIEERANLPLNLNVTDRRTHSTTVYISSASINPPTPAGPRPAPFDGPSPTALPEDVLEPGRGRGRHPPTCGGGRGEKGAPGDPLAPPPPLRRKTKRRRPPPSPGRTGEKE